MAHKTGPPSGSLTKDKTPLTISCDLNTIPLSQGHVMDENKKRFKKANLPTLFLLYLLAELKKLGWNFDPRMVTAELAGDGGELYRFEVKFSPYWNAPEQLLLPRGIAQLGNTLRAVHIDGGQENMQLWITLLFEQQALTAEIAKALYEE